MKGENKMKTFTEREENLCDLLSWLACHVDEDVEYKSKHVKQSLNDACDYLEEIGWYDFNVQRKYNERLKQQKGK